VKGRATESRGRALRRLGLVRSFVLAASIAVGCGDGAAVDSPDAHEQPADAFAADAPGADTTVDALADATAAPAGDGVDGRPASQPDVRALSDDAPTALDGGAPIDAVFFSEDGPVASDASAEGGPADASSAHDAPVADAAKIRTLTRAVQNAPWRTGGLDGLAADVRHRVYRIDDGRLFMVEGGVVSTYLSIEEAVDQVGLRPAARFIDLDMGADGVLHVLLTGTLKTANTSATLVTQSSGPHLVTNWRDLSTYTASQVSVIGAGKIAFIDYSGLWIATATSQKLLFPESMLKSTDGCAAQELTANPSGVFLYEPGCNIYPILRGNADGSAVRVLYEPTLAPIYGGNFLCTARDPAGGFYMMVNDVDGGSPRMYHVSEDAEGAVGLEHVVTEPSFGEARLTQAERGVFESCSLATAPDGTVYVQTVSQLWVVSPP
jgi:hypothetical protein